MEQRYYIRSVEQDRFKNIGKNMLKKYVPRIFIVIILGAVNVFALTLCLHPNVSENYYNFYILQNITIGEYEANEIRGIYSSHQDRWKH